MIQDFPLQDKRVFLHIKRRRWLNTHTEKVEQQDWNQVTQGTRITGEFARFMFKDWLRESYRKSKRYSVFQVSSR